MRALAVLCIPAVAHGSTLSHYERVPDDAHPELPAPDRFRLEAGGGTDAGNLIVDGRSRFGLGVHGEVGLYLGRFGLATDLREVWSPDGSRTRAAVYGRFAFVTGLVEAWSPWSHQLMSVFREDYFVELGADVLRRGASVGVGTADLVLGQGVRPSFTLRLERSTEGYEFEAALTVTVGN